MAIVRRDDPAIETLNVQRPHLCDGCGQKFVTPVAVFIPFFTVEMWFCGKCACNFGAQMIGDGAIVQHQKHQGQVELVQEIEALNLEL